MLFGEIRRAQGRLDEALAHLEEACRIFEETAALRWIRATGEMLRGRVHWDRGEPLDLRQAEKAYELAVAAGAEDYAPTQLLRARTTLAQASGFSSGKKNKATIDYSRRSLALSAEALQVTARSKEAEAVEAEIARRKAEMEALTARASEAEANAAAAAVALAEANRAIEEVQRSRTEAEAAVLAAQGELSRIETERLALAASVSALESQSADLEREKAELEREKTDLSARLQGALSQVADTQESARGMIVSLPDILFDTNQATLKNEARVVIAKLAGILLILPELNLRVEGHTDSTGSADYNQGLSERRATSVRDFLAQQGIDGQRMVAVGYGLTRPVADNKSREGRAKNRRVEIVIAEGRVAAD